MDIVIPPHRGSFALQHNDHRNTYQTVRQMIEDNPDYYDDESFVSAEDRQRCIETDEIWTAHWYPEHPVSFHTVHASTMEVLNEALAEHL